MSWSPPKILPLVSASGKRRKKKIIAVRARVWLGLSERAYCEKRQRAKRELSFPVKNEAFSESFSERDCPFSSSLPGKVFYSPVFSALFFVPKPKKWTKEGLKKATV